MPAVRSLLTTLVAISAALTAAFGGGTEPDPCRLPGAIQVDATCIAGLAHDAGCPNATDPSFGTCLKDNVNPANCMVIPCNSSCKPPMDYKRTDCPFDIAGCPSGPFCGAQEAIDLIKSNLGSAVKCGLTAEDLINITATGLKCLCGMPALQGSTVCGVIGWLSPSTSSPSS